MPAYDGLAWTFDTVAATYEKLRPGYVAPLYQTVLDYHSIGVENRVVEVGSGGGQELGNCDALLTFLKRYGIIELPYSCNQGGHENEAFGTFFALPFDGGGVCVFLCW